MSIQITEQDAGTLNEQGGIVAGRVAQYAEALGTTPAAVLEAIDRAGVELMVDTAKQNPDARTERDRPTCPELRCLAMTRSDFARVLAEMQRTGDSTPAESRQVAAVRG